MKKLPFYGRFIDNSLGVWIDKNQDPTTWHKFIKTFNSYVKLKLTTAGLTKRLVFLDFTVSITNQNTLKFEMYSKPMNLHLYIPAHSAHPPGVTRGTIIGRLKCFHQTNTDLSDFIYHASKLYFHFSRRGHTPTALNKYFKEACDLLCTNIHRNPNIKDTSNNDDRRRKIFYHVPFHPRGITRRNIRNTYEKMVGTLLQNRRLTIAISCPKNLRDMLKKFTLRDIPKDNPSDYT